MRPHGTAVSAPPAAPRLAAVACALALGGAAVAQTELDLSALAPIDVDRDGRAELEALRPLTAAGPDTAPRVLVLVEPRLVDATRESHRARIGALHDRLTRYAADLARDGYRARVVTAEVRTGAPHEDGRAVLGIRRLLQAVADRVDLAGVVLVGHFPDATLVRTCNWRKSNRVELPDRAGKKTKLPAGARWLRRVPELVAHKFDLVLADLDGDWESRYLGPASELQRVEAWFADPEDIENGGLCGAMRSRTMGYRDVFHVDDGALEVDMGEFTIRIDDADRDHECTATDRERVNAIAQPEIAVSRIDARGVAWSPAAEYLDAAGKPRAVEFGNGTEPPRWDHVWVPDRDLELQLLCEYFDRNHAFRTDGVPSESHRPASIAWGLPSGMASVRQADESWAEFDTAGYDVKQGVDLRAVAQWFGRPATLRTLRAHSNGHHAVFAKTDIAALHDAIGGAPWSFTRHGRSLVPSLHSACRTGHAGFFFYRTLWANGAPATTPFLMVHTGCEALSPPGHALPFEDPRYGARQHAESILFFTPCVALIGRAKVFYDEPRGFVEALRRGGTVGDGWRAYFATEASAASWGQAGGDIGRKRSYFWSLLGDWTLRLPRVQ